MVRPKQVASHTAPWSDNGEQKMRSRPHDEAMAELYRSDPAFAVEVINGILKDEDQSELLVVLRQIAQAFGGVQAVAEQPHLNQALFRPICNARRSVAD
jgi:DNA-binding phage protein